MEVTSRPVLPKARVCMMSSLWSFKTNDFSIGSPLAPRLRNKETSLTPTGRRGARARDQLRRWKNDIIGGLALYGVDQHRHAGPPNSVEIEAHRRQRG